MGAATSQDACRYSCRVWRNHRVQLPPTDVFRRRPTERTTSSALRKLRRELANAQAESRKTYAELVQSQESAERAFLAVASETDDETRTKVQSLRPGLAKRIHQASTALAACRERSSNLQSKLDQQEAWFAQSQIGRFIHSGRCEITPLGVAMAMAGLPYLTARVSSERCAALKDNLQPGHTYKMFQAVEAVFAHPPQTVIERLEKMRAYLLEPRREKQVHIAALRENWYFLKAAIESIYRKGVHPSGAIPYRIFAEYQRRFECQSQADVLLAPRNHL